MEHDEESCEKANQEEEARKKKSKGLGPWLRFDQARSKIETKPPEKKGSGEKEHKKNGTPKGKLTEKLMEKLAGLTVTDPLVSITEKVNGKVLVMTILDCPNKRESPKLLPKRGASILA